MTSKIDILDSYVFTQISGEDEEEILLNMKRCMAVNLNANQFILKTWDNIQNCPRLEILKRGDFLSYLENVPTKEGTLDKVFQKHSSKFNY